ncbi:MAG: hypothetical protein N2508_15145, partial [Anaerolineae bacterium]|nr:hypothetical protein [Anaerolineae bacterium]
ITVRRSQFCGNCSNLEGRLKSDTCTTPESSTATASGDRRARRRLILFLTLPVPLIGVANLLKMALALRYSVLLPDLPMTISWAYLAATGGFWGVVFAFCTVGLARFRPWGRWATLAAVTLYEAHVWFNRLVFATSDYARLTIPRDLALTLLLLLITWVTLNLPALCSEFQA